MVRLATRRFALASAGGGGVAWLALVAGEVGTPVDRWLALALLAFVPWILATLGRDHTDEPSPPSYRLAVALQPAGAVGVVGSAMVGNGTTGAALAALWIPVTVALGVYGLARLRDRGLARLDEFLVVAGLGYAVVGAVALVLYRLEITFHFEPIIVHLTAIHYHYAGLILPVVVGLVGRFVPETGWRRSLYRIVGWVVVAGMVLIAVGITASPTVEVISVAFFTVTVAGFALLTLSLLPRVAAGGNRRDLLAAAAFAVAALSIVATMGFALAYGWQAYSGADLVTLTEMVRWHGTTNALGFALFGLLGCWLAAPDPHVGRTDGEFSPLTAGWRVGTDYPHRRGLVGPEAVPGQMVDMADFERPEFDPHAVDDEIRRFYEETSNYDLVYELDWLSPFRTGARVASAVTRRMEQLNLPAPGASGPHHTDSELLDIVAAADPRADTRFWVRSDPDTGRAVFVAAYGTHETDGERYMNVALPLPYSNMTAVLHAETLPTGGGSGAGLRLTSEPRDATVDEGLFQVTPLGAIRLPMHEEFRVWPVGASDAPEPIDPDATLVASHRMWAFGGQFLDVDYALIPSEE